MEEYQKISWMWDILKEMEDEQGTEEHKKILKHITDCFYDIFKYEIYEIEQIKKEMVGNEDIWYLYQEPHRNIQFYDRDSSIEISVKPYMDDGKIRAAPL